MKSSNLIIVIITGVICSLLIAWALWGNGVSADTAGDNSPSASNMATDPTKNTESNTDSKVVSGQETSTGADTADATPAPSGNSQPQKSDPSPKDKPSSQAVPTDAPKSPENKNAKAKPQESTETAAVPQDEDDDPNNPYVSVNLKDVEMKTLISKVAEWTGKVIIPHQDVMGQKITIYAPHKLRQNEALALIYAALQTKGFIAEDTPQAVYLRPIKDVRLTRVPTITADEPLAQFEDKTQIVQKFFRLKNYSPTQLQQIILPLIPDYGYITADENTGMLVVIESVANLLRIEGIIRELDTPDAEQTVTRIFPLEHGEPAEIVQLVRLLIGGNTSGRRSPRSAPEPEMHPGGGGEGPPSSPAPSRSTVINLINSRVVLIPEPRRKWIIAQASAADMNRIAAWIEQLDLQEPEQADYEVVQLQYADVEDVARQLNNTLQNMPGAELRSSVMIQPLERVRQIMIFANPQKREMIKTLIAEIDIPSGQFITRHFKLTYADPEIVKENIESLFSDAGSSNYYYRYYSRSSRDSQDTVRVIAFTTLKQVTVIASAENMAKVEQQIAEWDVPIDVKEVKPMILELHNSDPVKMAELLSKLFTEKQESNRRPWWWDEYDRGGDKKKIVGALYGKLTFEAVPETRKIIVISQIPEAYEVVRELAEELDKQVPAELPMVITLKYADCEMLCEQLNAILNESGTVSPYRLSRRGLSDYSVDVTTGEKKTTQNNQEEQTPANQTTPWWNKAQRSADNAMPTSNVIGKVRFIPVFRSKAVLVLAPSEYHDALRTVIENLDKPAKQVLVKAVLLSVNHENATSLGLKVSSNPDAFGALGDNMLEAFNTLTFGESYGALRLDSSLPVNVLVDLLVKHANARILNQPRIWTKDNDEAIFFKGRSVPFIEGSQSSTEGTSIRQDVKYRNVGVTLRVRPNITPEKAVDLTINLMVSEVEPQTINGNIVTTLMDNTTNMIVSDGQTLMLSGILTQVDRDIETKVPLIGDIPILGGLFRHTDQVKSNEELIAFITPYVFDENTTPDARGETQDALDKMHLEQETLNTTMQKLY